MSEKSCPPPRPSPRRAALTGMVEVCPGLYTVTRSNSIFYQDEDDDADQDADSDEVAHMTAETEPTRK